MNMENGRGILMHQTSIYTVYACTSLFVNIAWSQTINIASSPFGFLVSGKLISSHRVSRETGQLLSNSRQTLYIDTPLHLSLPTWLVWTFTKQMTTALAPLLHLHMVQIQSASANNNRGGEVKKSVGLQCLWPIWYRVSRWGILLLLEREYRHLNSICVWPGIASAWILKTPVSLHISVLASR